MKIKCTKDFKMIDGEIAFVAGKEYELVSQEEMFDTTGTYLNVHFINETGESHTLESEDIENHFENQ